MQDLTPILIVVAIVLGVGGFFLFQRQRKKDERAPVSAPVPVAAPAPDVAALQAALKQAIDKLHASTPAVPVAAPVAVPAPAPAVTMAPDGTAPIGTTAASWQEPPAPWPIDARYMNPAQIASLSPEGTGRANMWQQALMSAAMTGNGQNPVPAALMIYRAGFTKTEDLNKPLDETWQRVFAAYNVPVPVPQDPRPWQAAAPRPGEEAYDVRLQK